MGQFVKVESTSTISKEEKLLANIDRNLISQYKTLFKGVSNAPCCLTSVFSFANMNYGKTVSTSRN